MFIGAGYTYTCANGGLNKAAVNVSGYMLQNVTGTLLVTNAKCFIHITGFIAVFLCRLQQVMHNYGKPQNYRNRIGRICIKT